MKWLIKQDVAAELKRVRRAGLPTAPEQLAQFMAYADDRESSDPSRIMSVAGGVAEIRIEGTLTPSACFASYYYGGGNTQYGDIRAALAKAEVDPTIKKVVFYIDSPGGRVDGLFETLDALKAFTKPRSVRAACACSAAYAFAAVAGGKIEATSEAAEFGSIGVAVSYMVWPEDVDIASTDAPEKRPDVTTDEGKAIVRKHLDDIHELFVEHIAEGRGIKPSQVNADFGKGGVLLAREAKKNGLIDKLPKTVKRGGVRASADSDPGDDPDGERAPAVAAQPATLPAAIAAEDDISPSEPRPAAGQRKAPMDQKTLQAEHPAVYKAIRDEGAEAAAETAITAERDRVEAHLTMGEASGDMKTALEAVKSGAPMTVAIQAKYMAASMGRTDQAERQSDADDAAGAVAGAAAPDADADFGDAVADAMGAPQKDGGTNA